MYVTIYLTEDEHRFVKDHEAGWVRGLIQKEMALMGEKGLTKEFNQRLTGNERPTSLSVSCKSCGALLISRATTCLVCGAKV